MPDAPVVHPHLRAALGDTPFILNGGYTPQAAAEAVTSGAGRASADAISFGLLYLANPDLVERLRVGVTTFNTPDPATFYTRGSRGYTDYPTLETQGAG